MKQIFGFLILGILSMFITVGMCLTEEVPPDKSLRSLNGEEVVFPDVNLEAAIREAIGKLEGALLKSDLEELKGLDASGRGIDDLSGIEHCTNLQGLRLRNNQINNISPLSSLTKLHSLDLPNNRVRDISSLAHLTNLRALYLDNNQVEDISPLEQLTSIGEDGSVMWERGDIRVRLGLSNNQIKDISTLVNNSGIGEGDGVDLRGNPLNSEGYSVHIPALQARGVNLLFENILEAEENPLACALLVAKTETIKDTYDKAVVFADIAVKYAEAGRKDEALETLSQAIQIAKRIDPSTSLDAVALSEIADKYAEIGYYDQAIQVANTIELADYKASALSDIAGEYLGAGQKDKALEMLFQALQVAKTIEDAHDKAIVLIEIAGKYIDAGQKVDDKARGILHEISVSAVRSRITRELKYE